MIILGDYITVYKHHNDITYENFTAEGVLHWRQLLEEYVKDIKYIKGHDNYALDALSMLPFN